MRRPLLLFALCSTWPFALAAQPCPSRTPNSQRENFTLTEFTYARRLNRSRADPWLDPRGGVLRLTWELGGMENRSADWAVGGTIFGSLGETGSRLGVRARVRRWLTESTSLEVAAGPVLSGRFSEGPTRLPGASATLALDFNDELAVVAGAELMRMVDGKDDLAVTLGMRGGSGVGVAAGVFGFLLLTMATLGAMGGS